MSKKAVQVLLSVPDLSTKAGRRDLSLIIIIYSTAARIDEILSLKTEQLHLDAEKPNVTIIGKGSKIRTLYLLAKAVAHLKKYLKEFLLAISLFWIEKVNLYWTGNMSVRPSVVKYYAIKALSIERNLFQSKII